MMIGIKVAESGKYYFNLKETNSSEIEEIWLKDQFTSTIHNLATGSYEFISEKGEFKNRFRIEVGRILNTIECNSANHALDLLAIYGAEGQLTLASEMKGLDSL